MAFAWTALHEPDGMLCDESRFAEPSPMHAYVYKSLRKQDTYVFLAERDDFERVPEAVRAQLGALQFVLDLALTPGRRLAQGNAEVVRENLALRGFHLQLPPSLPADPMSEDWGTDA